MPGGADKGPLPPGFIRIVFREVFGVFGDGSFVPPFMANKRGFCLHCLPTFDTFILEIILSFLSERKQNRGEQRGRFFCHTKGGTEELSSMRGRSG